MIARMTQIFNGSDRIERQKGTQCLPYGFFN